MSDVIFSSFNMSLVIFSRFNCFLVFQVLATGLSGLYSDLPRKIEIPSEDWYRITDEEVARIPEISMFLNTLGFCNAVAQVIIESEHTS